MSKTKIGLTTYLQGPFPPPKVTKYSLFRIKPLQRKLTFFIFGNASVDFWRCLPENRSLNLCNLSFKHFFFPPKSTIFSFLRFAFYTTAIAVVALKPLLCLLLFNTRETSPGHQNPHRFPPSSLQPFHGVTTTQPKTKTN